MKNKYINIIFVLFFSVACFAQDMSSGYFVAPNPAISEAVREQLGNKLKVALSKAGIMATDGYFPMVTVIKYDEIETIEISGMRKMYKCMGNVTMIITFTNTNSSLAAAEFAVEGVGVSKEIAQKQAINNIKIPSAELKDMVSKAKTNYTEALESFCSGKIIEAKKLRAKRDFNGALKEASQIPAGTKSSQEASKLIAEIQKEMDKQYADEKKAQAEREKRAYELEKEKMKISAELEKEKQKTEREVAKSKANQTTTYYFNTRSAVEDLYYSALGLYYDWW